MDIDISLDELDRFLDWMIEVTARLQRTRNNIYSNFSEQIGEADFVTVKMEQWYQDLLKIWMEVRTDE